MRDDFDALNALPRPRRRRRRRARRLGPPARPHDVRAGARRRATPSAGSRSTGVSRQRVNQWRAPAASTGSRACPACAASPIRAGSSTRRCIRATSCPRSSPRPRRRGSTRWRLHLFMTNPEAGNGKTPLEMIDRGRARPRRAPDPRRRLAGVTIPLPPDEAPKPLPPLAEQPLDASWRLHWDAQPLRRTAPAEGVSRFDAPHGEYAVTYVNADRLAPFAEVYGDLRVLTKSEAARRWTQIHATRDAARSCSSTSRASPRRSDSTCASPRRSTTGTRRRGARRGTTGTPTPTASATSAARR